MKKHLLFLSNPVGIGHLFRDLAVARMIREIERKVRIVIATEVIFKKVVEDFGFRWIELLPSKKFTFHPNLQLAVAGKKKSATSRSLFGKIRNIGREVSVSYANLRSISAFIAREEIDLVFVDEMYYLVPFLKTPNLQIIFCSDYLKLNTSPAIDTLPVFMIEQWINLYLVNILPRFIEKWLYLVDRKHLIDSNRIDFIKKKPVEIVGPVTRFFYQPVPKRTKQVGPCRIRVFLGGCADGYPIIDAVISSMAYLPSDRFKIFLHLPNPEMYAKISMVDPKTVEIHPFNRNIDRYLADADIAVVQAGLSTVLECMIVGIPLIVIPRKHWEQQNNARYAQEQAQAVILDLSTLDGEKLAKAIVELADKPWTTSASAAAMQKKGKDAETNLRRLLEDILARLSV